MNDADGTHELVHIQRDRRYHAVLDLPRHTCSWQDAHTRLNCDRLLDRLDVVELHRGFQPYTALTQRAIDRLADREVLLEGDELLSGQILRRHHALFCESIRSMTHKHHGLVMPGDDFQGAMRSR